MDEKPDQIIGHIEAKRDELGRNLSELEDKVRRTTDWRTHFDKNPMLILGAALGGGMLVGSMVGGSSSRSHTRGIRPRKSFKYSGSSTGSTSGSSTGSTSGSSTGSTSGSSTGSTSGSSTGSGYYTPASLEHSAASFATSGGSTHRSSMMSGGQMHQVVEALDHIKGALIAFGIAKTKEFLSQAVPGLEHHLGDMSTSSRKHRDDYQARPYATGSAADYRTGTQSSPGAQTSYGTSQPNQNPSTVSTGRASEADEYAGVGNRNIGTNAPAPSSGPQPKP
jgi:hypothetical protein